MPLVNTAEIMNAARAANIGQGAFNVIHLESAQALIRGAEIAQTPVILQISENCVSYHGGLEPVALATLAAARNASVSVAVHLDHAESEDLARAAVDLGFGSIMFDGAHLDYAQNVEATRRVTEYAHAAGVYVEAELGKIGGKDGAHAPGVRTDPAEALSFVTATGVDALAVAVGSSHAMLDRSAALDIELIAGIRATLDVPLVLHGSSGVSDANIVAAINAGMTKINVSTHLNGFFTSAIREYLEENPTVVDSRKYLARGRDAMAVETGRLLTLFAGK